MKTDPKKTLSLLLLLALAACGPNVASIEGFDEEEGLLDEAEALTVVSDDDLNGLWSPIADGGVVGENAVVESWPAVGIRLTFNGASHQLTRSADVLTGAQVSLAVKVNGSSIADDTLEGTVAGQAVVLKRDTRVKPPIVLSFPGDRPFRSYLTEVIAPAAQRDRESYVTLSATKTGPWLRSCELYKSGSWLYKYFKGTTWTERNTSFHNVVNAVNYVKTTPRRMTKEYKFSSALQANITDPALMGLAMSTFSMYFTAAGGRALRMPITSDSMAYFITDRPVRAERIGLVVMKTPTHGPLASTFGRQLLDLGEMPPQDSAAYSRAMMDLLVKSDVSRATALSGVGRSALTDWYAVMAIEDYRGVAFGWPTLGWGYNMTNVQFYGLVTRALARPGEVDSAGLPVKGQVIVAGQLRPGEASYADVLNSGNDMQEYQDMARLKTLTTQYLRAYHPALVAELEASFAGIVPSSELDYRARADLFHFICAQLYDVRGRTAVLKDPARATRAVNAVVALFDALNANSAQLEAYLLANGITKSNVAAPKSTGY